MWRSTTARLALAVSGAFLLSCVLLGTGIYFAVSTLLERDAHELVRADAAGLRDLYRHAGYARLREEVQARVDTPEDPDALYALLSAEGKLLVGGLEQMPPWRPHARWLEFVDEDADDEPRVVANLQQLDNGQFLLTGLRTRSEDGFLQLILHSALAALLAAAALGALVGGWTSRWVARRLGSLDRTAERVAAGEMQLRARSDGSGDAFDRVANRFNGMLDRIQELLDGVRHATDHIAHDLRTPLSRLRSRLEQIRSTPAIASNRVAGAELEAALAETDQLLQSFGALLRLSRIEAQAQPVAGEAVPVDLQALLADAVELYAPIAAEQGMWIEQHSVAVVVAGDPDQLFQMVINLLDNAIKYGPVRSRIGVSASHQDDSAVIEIEDRGEGIPVAERQRVFDRFQRLQAERSTPGTGLGLSLVRAIVQRHRGQIVLLDADPGLRVRITLPLHADPASHRSPFLR